MGTLWSQRVLSRPLSRGLRALPPLGPPGMLDLPSPFSTLCHTLLPMSAELTLQIQNNVAAVQAANETVSRWLAERGAPADLQYFANLVIEELATNCIKYAYGDEKEHRIEVKLSVSPNSLVMTVSDDGHPFNPLEAPAPDMALGPEDRPVGGLGLHLLRKMSDSMDYIREDGKNRLTLRRITRSPS